MDKNKLLDAISDLVQEIQTDEKTGNFYGRYATEHLWNLGDMIQQYRETALDRADTVGEILRHLQKRSIRCLPLLLKNAETARRVWNTREEYLGSAAGVSYGKLKAVLPILDPEFVSEAGIQIIDVRTLIGTLKSSSLRQVLQSVRRLREKYGPRWVGFDFDELYSDIYTTTEKLSQLAKTGERRAIEAHRTAYPPDFVENTRRLISSMKNEDSHSRLAANDFPVRFERDVNEMGASGIGIIGLVQSLCQIGQGPPIMRERLRQRVGIARLGELSTLLKALSDDDELERYNRAQKLIEQIRVDGIHFGE